MIPPAFAGRQAPGPFGFDTNFSNGAGLFVCAFNPGLKPGAIHIEPFQGSRWYHQCTDCRQDCVSIFFVIVYRWFIYRLTGGAGQELPFIYYSPRLYPGSTAYVSSRLSRDCKMPTAYFFNCLLLPFRLASKTNVGRLWKKASWKNVCKRATAFWVGV